MKKTILSLLIVLWVSTLNVNAQGCQAFFQYTMGMCPEIMFFDGSQADPGDQVVAWAWDFGDGNTSTTQNPVNTYAANGNYSVCLTIVTLNGCSSTYCDSLSITCIQQPSCDAFFQYTLGNCPEVTFADGSSSSAQIVSWVYDFGDGNTATTPNATNTYAQNGNYLACLTIMTVDSCESTYCDTITIDCITAGLEESNSHDFTVGPNPVKNDLNVRLTTAGSVDYRIMDIKGAVYGEGRFESSLQHQIDVSELNQGIYLLELQINGARSIQRFVKE